MDQGLAELEERFQQLNRSRSALSAEMRATALELSESGQTPSLHLDSSLGEYESAFESFRIDLGLSPDDENPESESVWSQFQGRLDVCRQASMALQQLRSVERLSTPPGFEATLDPVRRIYHEVTALLLASPWSDADLLREVQAGRHPLCRVVSLVERLRELSDDEWTGEMMAVQQTFGIPVSTAIARGKVELTDHHESKDW